MFGDMRGRLSSRGKADRPKMESTIIKRLVFFWKHLSTYEKAAISTPYVQKHVFNNLEMILCMHFFKGLLNNLFFHVLFYSFINTACIQRKILTCQEINERETGGVSFPHGRYRPPKQITIGRDRKRISFQTANIVYEVNCRFSVFTILKCQRAKQFGQEKIQILSQYNHTQMDVCYYYKFNCVLQKYMLKS